MAHPLDPDDTIVAIATPPGKGALAVIRLSGQNAFEIAKRHIRPWPRSPRAVSLCELYEDELSLDQAVVTLFPAPHSFTGESVVEISTHGGHIVPLSVTAALVRSGARPAAAGEFTRRAILNGKLDLIQAEAIGELVNSKSSAMQRAALAQLHGGLTRKLEELREGFLALEALIAYEIDFPEEDDGPIDEDQIASATARVERDLDNLKSTAAFGEVIREGAVVVIAGAPNTGKSSLFNALIGTTRAIVTELPGTTRDALEAVIDAGDWLLRLVDTAGLRNSDDRIERLGIEVSERYLASADIVLACGDTAEALRSATLAISALSSAPVLPVWTKADLVELTETDKSGGKEGEPIFVSAENRTALEELLGAISARLRKSYGEHVPDAPILTTARQRGAVESALRELRAFTAARTEQKVPATIAAVHLQAAVGALEELVGAVSVDDVLSKLFSTFCVGK